MAYTLSLLLAEGFLEPLAFLVVRRSLKSLAAEFMAGFKLLWLLPAIRRHQALTAQVGEHFL